MVVGLSGLRADGGSSALLPHQSGGDQTSSHPGIPAPTQSEYDKALLWDN